MSKTTKHGKREEVMRLRGKPKKFPNGLPSRVLSPMYNELLDRLELMDSYDFYIANKRYINEQLRTTYD